MDIYDEAVAYLQSHPEEIPDAYTFNDERMGGALFQWATPDGKSNFAKQPDDKYFGDIISIKRDKRFIGATQEITEVVALDNRIPINRDGITVDNLEVFATWQRFLDKKLGRKKTWQLPKGNPVVVKESRNEEPEDEEPDGDEYVEGAGGDEEVAAD